MIRFGYATFTKHLAINISLNVINNMRIISCLALTVFLFTSCRTVRNLNAHDKDIFCKGVENIIQYANDNNSLPDKISVAYTLKITPDNLVHAEISPELKRKILKKDVSKRWRRARFYNFECDRIARFDKPVIDFAFQYQAEEKIIVLSLATVNEKTRKVEYFYYIGLLDDQGKLKEIEESNWVEK